MLGPESLGLVSNNSFGKASVAASSSYSPALSGSSSKNGTLKRNKQTTPTPSVFLPNSSVTTPTGGSADNQLDFLLKSLAKEALSGIHRDEARNETKAEG